jgi:hypothetical protein
MVVAVFSAVIKLLEFGQKLLLLNKTQLSVREQDRSKLPCGQLHVLFQK